MAVAGGIGVLVGGVVAATVDVAALEVLVGAGGTGVDVKVDIWVGVRVEVGWAGVAVFEEGAPWVSPVPESVKEPPAPGTNCQS